MRKKITIIGGGIVGLLILLMFFANSEKKSNMPIAEVKKGDLLIAISTTGELKPVKQENIVVSDLSMRHRIYKVTIVDMVSEGTIVKKGDYIATLNKDEIRRKTDKYMTDLETVEHSLSAKKIDTTIEMKGLRDNIQEQIFNIEEAKVELEQSKFEAPATIRKVTIKVENAIRTLEQNKRNYKAKLATSTTRMKQLEKKKKRYEDKISELQQLSREFTIKAPASGMVTYYRDRRGTKRKTGDVFHVYWDKIVATLPDLSKMVSVTYINETDISKVKIGQEVIVIADAFAENELEGKIKKVANIGEILSGSETKVFEIEIEIEVLPEGYRPGMTTSNSIITKRYKDIIYIPIEAVHSNDSISYVYKSGLRTIKQIVELGDANDDDIIVISGLSSGDEVLLVVPEDM